MRFSIITPSFRSSQWLRLCVESVANQEGVEFEHIVQDSCSDDGTQEWLAKEPRVKAFIEKDQGMYDAINRGFRRATGEILAYLNCDEQYLPGGLMAVHACFAANPQADVVVSDSVVTDAQGEYICSRLALAPGKHQTWVRFPVLSSGLFVRRRVVEEMGIHLDTRWRALGDFFWVMEMVKRGARFAVLPQLTSVFTDTGENLCLTPNALREIERQRQMTPSWIKLLRPLFVLLYRLRLAARGSLIQRPFTYSLYTLASPTQRFDRHVSRPTSFWKGRR